jgi:hypothetical protein
MHGAGLLSGRIIQIQQGLARQFRHAGVGVPHKEKQQAQPAQFLRLYADEGNGFLHVGSFNLLFGSNGGISQFFRGTGSRRIFEGRPIREVRGAPGGILP